VNQHNLEKPFVPALGLLVLCLAAQNLSAQPNTFVKTNLVSDIPALAAYTDPNLVNPWGIAESATSPFWIADNGAGVTTLYNTSGTPQSLVVTLPNPSGGSSAPTGAVFNGSSAFNGDRFIFGTEDGTITGWRGALSTNGEILMDNSAAGSIYKGLALATVGSFNYLYATDFHNNHIDVLPSSGAPALTGSFTDPGLPAGFAPFNVRNISGQLVVTYAKQDADAEDDVAGPGNGFVDIFDLQGNFQKRLVSNGQLDSPWGLTLAPAGFGPFGGDLLVGNFGDGTINAFNPSNGNYLGTLDNLSANPLSIEGLWGLNFGNGGSGGLANTLYFTAGISGGGDVEDHGLFGSISHVPDTGATILLVAFAMVGMLAARRHVLRPGLTRV
jgi:uncharacterized protein (TIGR03118 family)